MNGKKVKYNTSLAGSFLDAVLCTTLYNVSLLVPITGFLLLVYKIKNVPMFLKKKWWVTTIITLILIGLMNVYMNSETSSISVQFIDPKSIKNIAGYLLIFLPIEILYYVFNARPTKIPVFDRIILTSLAVTITGYLYVKILNVNVDLLKEVISEINSIEKSDVEIVFNFIKKYIYYIIYSYVGIITYLTYYAFGRKSYPIWRISYGWLLLYIIPFFMIRFLHVDNIYLDNIMLIIKISFVAYGIKIVYNLIRKKINSDLFCQILAILLGLTFQNIAFIIGGLLSFEAIKITIIKYDGGK